MVGTLCCDAFVVNRTSGSPLLSWLEGSTLVLVLVQVLILPLVLVLVLPLVLVLVLILVLLQVLSLVLVLFL